MTAQKKKPAARAIAIEALADGATLADAAAAADVSLRTLRRWRADPMFAVELRQATAARFADASRVLAGGAERAARCLLVLVDDDDAPAHVRVSAATAVLRFTRESIELDDLCDRLARLEAAAVAAAQPQASSSVPGWPATPPNGRTRRGASTGVCGRIEQGDDR